jgi:nicotinamide-nucleotide amidase
MAMNDEALAQVAEIFERIGRPLTEVNRQQANLPTNCDVVSNRVGTAPGMWFKENNTVYVSMPGVPHEMKTMMKEQVLPRVQEEFHTPTIFHKLVKTIGIGESWLADLIKDWEQALPHHIKLAYLPSFGEVKLRLTASGLEMSQLQEDVAQQIELLKPLAGKYIYGYDKDSIPQMVGAMLKDRGLTIGCAESCTGGNVAATLTSIPGSSQYFQGGVVAYHNQIKEDILGVSPKTLKEEGAVSESTVIQMAQGIQKSLNCDIGLATSGIAGPDGGTPEKPVGTIWIAVQTPEFHKTRKLSLFKDRGINVKYTTIAVLDLVRQCLLQMDREKAAN